jgi:hypothetical protein
VFQLLSLQTTLRVCVHAPHVLLQLHRSHVLHEYVVTTGQFCVLHIIPPVTSAPHAAPVPDGCVKIVLVPVCVPHPHVAEHAE